MITNTDINAMMTNTDIDMFGTAIDIDTASIRNVSTDLASGTPGC